MAGPGPCLRLESIASAPSPPISGSGWAAISLRASCDLDPDLVRPGPEQAGHINAIGGHQTDPVRLSFTYSTALPAPGLRAARASRRAPAEARKGAGLAEFDPETQAIPEHRFGHVDRFSGRWHSGEMARWRHPPSRSEASPSHGGWSHRTRTPAAAQVDAPWHRGDGLDGGAGG